MGSLHTTHAAQPFIEQMAAAIAIFDGGMRYRAVSRRYLSDLAWLFSTEVLPPDKVIGRTIYEVSPDAPPDWRDVHARVLAGEELGQEEELRTAKGRSRRVGTVVDETLAQRAWPDRGGAVNQRADYRAGRD